MADLAMHNNLLAVYPRILERMKTVPGVKSVREVGDLNHLLNSADKRRMAAAVDGAVYGCLAAAVPTMPPEWGNSSRRLCTLPLSYAATTRAKSPSCTKPGRHWLPSSRRFKAGMPGANMRPDRFGVQPRRRLSTTTDLCFFRSVLPCLRCCAPRPINPCLTPV